MPQHVTMRWGYTGMNLPPFFCGDAKGLVISIWDLILLRVRIKPLSSQRNSFSLLSLLLSFFLFFTLHDFLLISK